MQRMKLPMMCAMALLLLMGTGSALAQPPEYGYEVLNTYPHDTSGFTQGLILEDGRLYESSGLYGESSLRELDLTTGAILRKVDLEPQFFGEGMTIFQGKLFQLTWREQTAFVYDPATFATIGQFFYTGEGWGLTHDDQHLIMSDGTNEIRFRDPTTFQIVRSIRVFDQGSPLMNINELEYINGEIYANIWVSNWIVRIDPANGNILGWINMSGLYTTGDVLNGIAYDPTSGHLLVTGKWWPSLFEVRVVGGPAGGHAPIADPQSVSTSEDTGLFIALAASDPDGDPLTFSIVNGPAHGTLSGTPPFVTYTPAANYYGSDSFTFKANDGTFDSGAASVSITVSPINDAPVAGSDSYTTALNTALTVPARGVLNNDSDVEGSPLTAVLVSGPAHGALTLNANGSFTYTPSFNYSGADGFVYAASDALATSNAATVSLTVTVPTAAPQVTLSPASLSFGNQVVGTASAPRMVTLTNTGTGPLLISGIAVTGPNAADFSQTHSCGGTVAPGAACVISVTFRPSATGSRKASVSIVDNAAASPRTIPLGGMGKKR